MSLTFWHLFVIDRKQITCWNEEFQEKQNQGQIFMLQHSELIDLRLKANPLQVRVKHVILRRSAAARKLNTDYGKWNQLNQDHGGPNLHSSGTQGDPGVKRRLFITTFLFTFFNLTKNGQSIRICFTFYQQIQSYCTHKTTGAILAPDRKPFTHN